MSSKPEILGWLVKRIQHRHHRSLEKGLAPLGLTLVQWNALREIERHPQCSQHRLAELTFNSDQAFGTLLTRLQKAGLTTPYSGGGRVTFHALTESGQLALEQGQKIMFAVTNQSFDTLTDAEQDELATLLHKVLGQDPQP